MKKKVKKDSKYESKLEIRLNHYWNQNYSIPMVEQHRFHSSRAWRFDFAFPEYYIAIEIQGFGTGHTSYKGMSRDYEKHNSAMTLGWGIIYLMSCDLTRTKIADTCNMILHIVTTRMNNTALLKAIGEIDAREPTVRTTDRESVNKIDEIRRRLLEGPNRPSLSPRSSKLPKPRRDFT